MSLKSFSNNQKVECMIIKQYILVSMQGFGEETVKDGQIVTFHIQNEMLCRMTSGYLARRVSANLSQSLHNIDGALVSTNYYFNFCKIWLGWNLLLKESLFTYWNMISMVKPEVFFLFNMQRFFNYRGLIVGSYTHLH